MGEIKESLPGKPSDVGVTAKDNRLLVEAVLHHYKMGIPWRGDLPERFGDFRVVHTSFSRWSKKVYRNRFLISCLSNQMINTPC